ncbi:class I SAM-dependent methyltransferase [Falsiroseomonas sp.]|uniref:class I SAM-dependent methyltransferase n=1 Tax=Falsiroseomonas sp. TaxID=2870721 RepID=UPI003F726468
MSGDGTKPARPAVVRPIPAAVRPAAGMARVAVAPVQPSVVAAAAPPAPSVTKPPRAARPQRPGTGAIAATPDDVRACYRMFLGREPENDGVLERHLAQAGTAGELVTRFLHSDEYRARVGQRVEPRLPIGAPGLAIETAASAAQMQAMLERTGRYWDAVGREAPHWSVLTQDRFRPDAIGRSIDAFYATGLDDSRMVEAVLTRHGIAPEALPQAIEFGCGVGRATLALARLFDGVMGCDISAPHLALAAEQAAARIVDNVAWHRSTPAAPMPPGMEWDFWFSRMVLQHNPPPVAARLLAIAFVGLRPGGVAMFQMATHRVGYAFSIDDYLAAATDPPGMEVHILPQPAIFALAREAGLEVLEVREDTHVVAADTVSWLSNLFVFRRPAS